MTTGGMTAPIPSRLDLNADAAESYGRWTLGDDERLFPLLTSVNVALGFHAGDPGSIAAALRLAARFGLAVGAHPGYPDLQGFGRRELALSPQEIHDATLYQLGALQAFLKVQALPLSHVKAHGALHHRVHADPDAARGFLTAVRDLGGGTPGGAVPVVLLAGPGGETISALAAELGLTVAREAFPERAYLADGRLAPRSLPGSSIHDPQAAAARALEMAGGFTTALDGARVALRADTLCIHGDNPRSVEIASAVRAALEGAGVPLRPLTRPA